MWILKFHSHVIHTLLCILKTFSHRSPIWIVSIISSNGLCCTFYFVRTILIRERLNLRWTLVSGIFLSDHLVATKIYKDCFQIQVEVNPNSSTDALGFCLLTVSHISSPRKNPKWRNPNPKSRVKCRTRDSWNSLDLEWANGRVLF